MEHINGNGKDKGKAGIRLDPTLNSAQDEVNAQIGEEQEESTKDH